MIMVLTEGPLLTQITGQEPAVNVATAGQVSTEVLGLTCHFNRLSWEDGVWVMTDGWP